MTDTSMGDEVSRSRFNPEPHACDRKVRNIPLREPTISQSLRLLIQTWAMLNPNATIEERQYRAALVATEIAGR
ncbi:hypothetical protein D3W54_12375 [Komagataeibacter medellinensis]|uniref:Transposase n=1 Tax=Komagataeibacter medellinensis TaxID=1177712 RepID=A0ABQ6VXC4_9PROT|nr:hypothetical protein [Komagataeibacter medellinensis]KAB8124854.1 hypothetical protein D3W54_12375 [Komagataeibacter medellinensis]